MSVIWYEQLKFKASETSEIFLKSFLIWQRATTAHPGGVKQEVVKDFNRPAMGVASFVLET